MAKRRTRRRKARNPSKRQLFGQITYYYETGNFVSQREYAMSVYGSDARGIAPLALTGRVKFVKRMFPTYEAALVHLTNINLGIEREAFPFYKYIPCKILSGYRQRGQKHVTLTKILAIPPHKKAKATDNGDLYVGTGVGQQMPSSGLIRQQWTDSLPLSQSTANRLYDYWSSGTVSASDLTPAVGTGWFKTSQLSNLSSGDGSTASSYI